MFKWKRQYRSFKETESDLVEETVQCKHRIIIQSGQSTGLIAHSNPSYIYYDVFYIV